jgi:hypothetical protein
MGLKEYSAKLPFAQKMCDVSGAGPGVLVSAENLRQNLAGTSIDSNSKGLAMNEGLVLADTLEAPEEVGTRGPHLSRPAQPRHTTALRLPGLR